MSHVPPVFSPSIVNVHIKHPPEASVQVHQVSRLDNYHNGGHQLKGSQSSSSSSTSYSYHHTESSQKIQHHGYNIVFPSQHGYQVSQYQPFTSKNMLGRCFQETAGSQVHCLKFLLYVNSLYLKNIWWNNQDLCNLQQIKYNLELYLL